MPSALGIVMCFGHEDLTNVGHASHTVVVAAGSKVLAGGMGY